MGAEQRWHKIPCAGTGARPGTRHGPRSDEQERAQRGSYQAVMFTPVVSWRLRLNGSAGARPDGVGVAAATGGGSSAGVPAPP